MYRKMGFSALGPAVPEGKAAFIPMAMPISGPFAESNRRRLRLHERHWSRITEEREPVSLMPGPVSIHPLVVDAWSSRPVSHRSAAFTEAFEEVRRMLNGLIPGMEAVIFPGAGTLANDAVAANLKAIFGEREGLVLCNGEFGERIANQAESAGLRFRQAGFRWGEPWSFTAIENALDRAPAWLWAVHLETSTGVLNDVERLLRLTRDTGCGVALDCVSSLGATGIASEAGNLMMASGVSGKALGSFAGLGFVYLSEGCRNLLAGQTLCPSFDLLRMYVTRGPLTTVPSPLLFALARALEMNYATEEAVARRLRQYCVLGQQVRRTLQAAGIDPLADDSIAAPNITTFTLPGPEFAERCLEAGYQIAHDSSYLRNRGWGQIATMGNTTPEMLAPLFKALPGIAAKSAAAV
ncbi:MAG: aminotransferase class V-fold PLP-dependent enzyme [Acidobacteriaceae bacterium]